MTSFEQRLLIFKLGSGDGYTIPTTRKDGTIFYQHNPLPGRQAMRMIGGIKGKIDARDKTQPGQGDRGTADVGQLQEFRILRITRTGRRLKVKL